jgi:hypothetical protein
LPRFWRMVSAEERAALASRGPVCWGLHGERRMHVALRLSTTHPQRAVDPLGAGKADLRAFEASPGTLDTGGSLRWLREECSEITCVERCSALRRVVCTRSVTKAKMSAQGLPERRWGCKTGNVSGGDGVAAKNNRARWRHGAGGLGVRGAGFPQLGARQRSGVRFPA